MRHSETIVELCISVASKMYLMSRLDFLHLHNRTSLIVVMESIEKLVAQANKSYALGRYEEAADVYAQASEKLVEVNGEDSPKNADVMFLYGRTLVKIAMQKSEVLGGGAQEEQPEIEVGKGKASAESGRFSFQGDEEVDEGADGDEDDEAEEPQTTADEDFQNAWEVLDLARVSFQHQLDAEEDQTGKTEIKKRIADTYDLLGEIALENGMLQPRRHGRD